MRIVIICIGIFLAGSCSSNKKPQEQEIKTYDTSALYYDIPLAVQNELSEIKRTFAFTYAVYKENDKTDSVAIDTAGLFQLASPFLQSNLNDSKHRKFYKEDLFEDGDTRSIVLNYSTNHPDLSLRSATVMLDNESQHLKRIDLLRAYNTKDSSVEERLSWSAGRNFQVIKIISQGGKEIIRQTNVFWKDR